MNPSCHFCGLKHALMYLISGHFACRPCYLERVKD